MLRQISNALLNDEKCRNWLTVAYPGGETLTAVDTINALVDKNSFGHGTFNRTTVSAFAGSRILGANSNVVPPNVSVTVNDQGAFFLPFKDHYSLSVGYRKYKGGTPEAQAAILIHELGHVMNIRGFKSDYNETSAAREKGKLVDENCRGLIESMK